LDCTGVKEKQQRLTTQILAFAQRCSGIKTELVAETRIRIRQSLDQKGIEFDCALLDDVLLRTDATGDEFLQVNFSTGKKILITQKLVGFKPIAVRGIDLSRLPKVVTTPDIVSVFDAIQDALQSDEADNHEVSVLKRVFEAVLAGGEEIGFDLSVERSWIRRVPSQLSRSVS
jgi:hypothetical protein